ncbi:MAG: type II toxin-antitoxin system prevent-host-death family antitoxin [Gemmatimonadetes bacterium]|nr:type II toxin-antitoxin system prevent-host-death family antitoxin [Gemmatimonadota bacterium]
MNRKTIGAAQFKEQCLALLDSVGPEGIVITKHGKPVARLVPVEHESRDLLGALAGKLRIKGDILSTGASWRAQS